MIFKRHTKKDNDQHLDEVIERLESLQNSQANLRQDIRKIIHDEILAVLDYRARRTTPL